MPSSSTPAARAAELLPGGGGPSRPGKNMQLSSRVVLQLWFECSGIVGKKNTNTNANAKNAKNANAKNAKNAKKPVVWRNAAILEQARQRKGEASPRKQKAARQLASKIRREIAMATSNEL